MSFDYDRLYGPAQPGTVTGVLATPAGTDRWILKQLIIANTTGASATITLGIGGTAAADQFCPTVLVSPNTVVTIDLSLVVNNGEEIHGLQGTSGAITLTLSGVIETP